MLPTKDRDKIREREMLRVAGESLCNDVKVTAVSVRSEVLKWASNQIHGTLPQNAWKGKSFECLSGGRNCIGSSFEDESRSFWALRVDTPDAHMAQRIWTTEVVAGYTPDAKSVLFSLRLLVSSPEETLQVAPAVPGLVRQIVKSCGLRHGVSSFDSLPWCISSDEELLKLVEYLIDQSRTMPVFVCSVPDGMDVPVVNSTSLAKATLGIARVVVINAAYSWALTRILGKHLSTYNGAIRSYLPGFSYDANPYSHRLFLPGIAAEREWSHEVSTRLRWIAASESLRHLRLDGDVLSFSAVREHCFDIERARLKQDGTADAMQLLTAQEQINALKEDLKRAENEIQQWLAEYEESDKQVQKINQRLKDVEFRNRQLVGQIKKRGDNPDSDIELPDSWDKFAEWCDDTLSGRVTLSARARREVRSPDFSEPKVAAQCLLWLANDYRDSRLNGADGDLRKPVTNGIKNDRCGAEAFPFEWSGQRRTVEWHIKNGGNTREPRRCLRIYYLWDEVSELVVIATMPAHIPTEAT